MHVALRDAKPELTPSSPSVVCGSCWFFSARVEELILFPGQTAKRGVCECLVVGVGFVRPMCICRCSVV